MSIYQRLIKYFRANKRMKSIKSTVLQRKGKFFPRLMKGRYLTKIKLKLHYVDWYYFAEGEGIYPHPCGLFAEHLFDCESVIGELEGML